MVLGVNIAFVYVVLYESSEAQTAAQIGIAFFKLAWSMVASPFMMRQLDAYFLPGDTVRAEPYFITQLLVALFNNIAIPCLIVMAIDSNCFSDILLPPTEHTVNYIYPVCGSQLVGFTCTRSTHYAASLDFIPPFSYSYQCSASIITSYSHAFVFMSISTIFVNPILQFILLRMYTRWPEDSTVHNIASRLLSRVAKPPASVVPPVSSLRTRPLVGVSATLVTLLTHLGILLTFGAIFPPIAIAMAVSISAVYFMMCRKLEVFLHRVAEAELWGYLQLIESECTMAGTKEQVRFAVRVILCFCCAFYTLFLFDTLGDALGFTAAAWVLIVLPLAPMVLFGVEALRTRPVRAVEHDNDKDAALGSDQYSTKQAQPSREEMEMTERITHNVLHVNGDV